MHVNQDAADFVALSGIKRVDLSTTSPSIKSAEASTSNTSPMRFLHDSEGSTSPHKTARGNQSNGFHFTKFHMHKFKRLLIAMIPFVLFTAGLALVSVGIFSYVENESILAVFIVSRDKGTSLGQHGADGSGSPLSAVNKAVVAAPLSGERLVTPFYYDGDLIGAIRISSVDIDVNAYQGDTKDSLTLGAGHYFGSFFPGQGGNVVIASHRTSYFRNFEYLKTGDLVEFETSYGLFTYKVRETEILENDFSSIAVDTDQEQLTMYTCYPFTFIGNAPDRYVVRCDLVDSELNT